MAVAEKEIAAVFVVVVARRLPGRRKDLLAGGLRLRVHLLVAQQNFRRVGRTPSHIIGVADSSFEQGFAGRQRRVFAARTNKRGCVRRVTRHEHVQCFFRGPGVGQPGEFSGVIVRVDFQGDENLLKVFLAGFLLRVLIAARTGSSIHRRQDEHQRQRDEKFDE